MGINVMPERASLRMARAKEDTVDGVATLLIKIPGTPGVDLGRIISGGAAWFEVPHFDDHVTVYLSDEDNITGAGAGAIVGKYTDDDVIEEDRGWYINKHKGWIDVRQLQMFGIVPAGLYMKIIGTKGDLSADTLRMNIKWGKR
jgi:hypothetical protein